VPSTSLKLLSSMAAREVLRALVEQYRLSSGQAVDAEAAGGVDVAKRVRAGEAIDIVVLARNAIEQLIAEGRLRGGSRVDLARSGVGIAVRTGSPKPDIASEAAVRQAVLGAKSVSYSTGPSGAHLEKLFERWGILDQVRARIVVPPPGVPVGSLVASGAAELGFQQLSELQGVTGLAVLGPLPAAIQSITTFSGGISVGCSAPGAARALLDYLASPLASEAKRRYGMEPA
jgi:molybdate transport system substrate-binding protein